MEGSGSGTVIGPLLAIEREDATGVLEFTAQAISTRIFVRGGEVVFAEAGSVSETLGRLLIRCERLTEEQVVAVIRRMTDALVDNQHVRFGEVVVEYGFLTADELDLALTQQVKEKVMGCVHRGTGMWTFIKDDPRIDDVGSYVVGTRPMLVEAAMHLPERRIEDVLHLDENRYPEIVAPESILVEEFELSKEEASILRELDGTSSLHFILSTAKSPNVLPLLAALVLGGGIDLRNAPTGTRQSSESRSVPPEFRTQRRARFRLDQDKTQQMAVAPVKPPSTTTTSTTRPTPSSLPPVTTPPMRSSDTLHDSDSDVTDLDAVGKNKKKDKDKRNTSHSSPTIAVGRTAPERRSSRQNLAPPTFETQDQARNALDRLKIDLESRKPVSSRRRWPEPKDEKERQLMAESAFHRGRLYLRAEDAERALPGLHRAFELRPEEREYELYVKWAQMLVNDAFKDDEQRGDIQLLAATIVRENRDCELGFSILGHCAMHDGKSEAALRFFQRAAHLDPKLIDAARLARLLAMRSQSGYRNPAQSKSDFAPGRSRLRGLLDTPLDEIVPVVIQKAGEVMQRLGSMTNEIKRPGDMYKSTPGAGIGSSPDTAATLAAVFPTPSTAIDIEVGPLTARLVTPKVTPAPPHVQTNPPPALMATQRESLQPQAQPQAQPKPKPQPQVHAPVVQSLRLATPTPSAPHARLQRQQPPPPSVTTTTTTVNDPSSVPPAPATPRAYPPPPSTPPPPPAAGRPPEEPAVVSQRPPPPVRKPLSPWRLPTSPVTAPHEHQLRQQQQQQQQPQSHPPPSSSVIPSSHLSLPPDFSIPEFPPPKRRGWIVLVLLASLGAIGGAAYYFGTQTPPTTGAAVPSSATASTPTISSVVSSATVTPPPSTSASTKPTPSTTPSAQGGGTTGTMRTKRAYGRRIYFDGRLIGEGGRDLTVACGVHRVKVGSAGVERTVTIPCGGAIELD